MPLPPSCWGQVVASELNQAGEWRLVNSVNPLVCVLAGIAHRVVGPETAVNRQSVVGSEIEVVGTNAIWSKKNFWTK
jgi:hypothetical protein